MKDSTNDVLAAFYAGLATDGAGRTLEEILHFTPQQLESNHDYVQWLFPTYEVSRVNPTAPVMTLATANRFQTDQVIRRNIRRSLTMMLEFYGLEFTTQQSRISVIRREDFSKRAEVWLTPYNHNYLRITRILKFLCIVRASELARALLECLENIYADFGSVIGPRPIEHWRQASPH
jgi:hypothetical protein